MPKMAIFIECMFRVHVTGRLKFYPQKIYNKYIFCFLKSNSKILQLFGLPTNSLFSRVLEYGTS